MSALGGGRKPVKEISDGARCDRVIFVVRPRN
jgi:hypothetical protein